MNESDVDLGSRIGAFWGAVGKTSATFVHDMLATAGDPTAEFLKVAGYLRAVHPGLRLVLGDAQTVRPQLVVSAGGILSVFPVVQQVVDAVPSDVLSRYDVRAFRPRMAEPSRLRIRVGGYEMDPNSIRWDAKRHRDDRSCCDLLLYIPDFDESLPADAPGNEPLARAVFMLLDHLVGEWAVAVQIGTIEWYSSHNASDLPTLVTLPDYLDRLSPTPDRPI